MNNLEQALEDINLIKKIINKTQEDFSKIAKIFLGVAIVNLFFVLLRFIAYTSITYLGYEELITQLIMQGVRKKDFICLLLYSIVYLYYVIKIKKKMNEFSMVLVNIWGIIFSGIGLFALIISEPNIATIQAIEFVAILIGICITALLIKKEWILIFCLIISGFYIFCLNTNATFVAAMIRDTEVIETMSSIVVDIMKSLGIFLLYLSVRSKKNEGRSNSRRVK